MTIVESFYKSCLQKILAYNVISTASCCGAIDIPGFDPGKLLKWH